jgi:hypothetical protein
VDKNTRDGDFEHRKVRNVLGGMEWRSFSDEGSTSKILFFLKRESNDEKNWRQDDKKHR